MATTLSPSQTQAGVTGPDRLAPATSERLLSLDAFRGFIMVMLASRAFGLGELKGDWQWLADQFEHVPWTGIHFWDLIQPAFMFMVGMALPFSFGRRLREAGSKRRVFAHVAWRSFLLILLSQLLMCVSAGRVEFQLINVLSQIAFTYFFAAVIMQWPFRRQLLICGLILLGHWAVFALFPGIDGAYSKGDNAGAAVDRWLLHRNYPGFYVTINFVTSIVTTMMGVWTGLLMKDNGRAKTHKIRILLVAAAVSLALGGLLAIWVPNVKRLWTPSFTLLSGGLVFLLFLAFFLVVDVWGFKRPVWPLSVVGSNSIFIYSLSIVLYGWLNRAVATFTGGFPAFGNFAPVAQATAVFAVLWLLCYWLWRNGIFIRV